MSSPIEDQLFAEICRLAEESSQQYRVLIHYPNGPELDVFGAGHENSSIISRNEAVATYRIDIMLRGKARLAVECDGHDYHDRTKQQAAYDRARDRDLLLQGIITIRFTGSEIVHSATRCADEVLRVFAFLNERERQRLEHLYCTGVLMRQPLESL